jgi:aspartate ammonia-lyase
MTWRTLAAEAGQLQLNVMEPVIAYCILESQTMFMNAADTLREHCLEGGEQRRLSQLGGAQHRRGDGPEPVARL